MATIPTLTTERLVLRPFRRDDVPAVERMLITPHIAEHTLNFPHPYPPGFAQDWISRHLAWAERGIHLQWAIALRDDTPVGAIGIALSTDPPHGDIGYWVGPDYWNHGYATEAAKAVIAYGFGTLDLTRMQATCFTGNEASARVLQKAGMREEGVLPAHILKDGVPRDVRLFAIHRDPAGVCKIEEAPIAWRVCTGDAPYGRGVTRSHHHGSTRRMASVSTYLNFAGQTEEAFEFYKSVFGTEYDNGIMRFGDMPPGEGQPEIPEEEKNLVLNVGMRITGGHVLMGSDVPPSMSNGFVMGTNTYICLMPDSRTEADRLFAALSEGGEVEMAMNEEFWGDYFGSFKDKFGVQWMVSTSAKE